MAPAATQTSSESTRTNAARHSNRALGAAAEALEAGGGAVEAVRAAVMVMEAFPLLNAGHGAALCSDGSVELQRVR